ncbi:hypothetical protein BCR33DRAFT_711106 [Rhizoclosmatium globosum]|uniref:C2H2-type domain-containing protein n=1 Tax=Rhizoclosmatium globosum TaxID=329046 RepID=A0A1Y2D587_9FUNG|nr:hypothetical protein BCR33DRAFT_711106 [Rhizoclosmatium globosum]|eukprot:ORY53745.1 hypothetical protein BCR33DRAFT_711106 [Rhizoclosmatium globosum]
MPAITQPSMPVQNSIAYSVQLPPICFSAPKDTNVTLPPLSSWVNKLSEMRIHEPPRSTPQTPTASPRIIMHAPTHQDYIHQHIQQYNSRPIQAIRVQPHLNQLQQHITATQYRSSPLASPAQHFFSTDNESHPSSPAHSSNSEDSHPTKKFHCDWEGCGRYFKTAWHLQSHMRHHTNLRSFGCTDCTLSFTRKHDLLRHARTVHAGKDSEPQYSCKACLKKFGRVDSLKRHLRLCKELPDQEQQH